MDDVAAVCREHGIRCSAPSGAGPAKAIKVRFWVLATQSGRESPLGFKFTPSADGSLSPGSCRSERVPITAEMGHIRTQAAHIGRIERAFDSRQFRIMNSVIERQCND